MGGRFFEVALSLVRGLNLLLLFLIVAAGALLAVVLPVMLGSWLSPALWTDFGRPLAALFGSPVESGSFTLKPWYLATGALLILLTLLLLRRLRMVARTIERGTPFSSDNVTHVRVIALLLGIAELVTLVRGLIVAILKGTGGKVEINVGIWISVLILLVLAEVFREGARLQEQEEMTA